MRIYSLVGIFMAAGFVACGPTQQGDDSQGSETQASTGGDSTSESTSRTTSASTSASSSASTSTTSNSTGDTGTDVCQEYYDQTGGVARTFVFSNQSDQTLFVGQSECVWDPLTMAVDAEFGEPMPWRPQACTNSCQQLLDGEGCLVCGACAPGSISMLLEPGQSAQVEWDGGFFPSAQLPSGCSREQGCEHCYHRTVPEVASIWVKSVAFTECTQSDAGDCACLSGQSPCEVWADTLGGTPIEVTAEVDLRSSDTIEIRFE